MKKLLIWILAVLGGLIVLLIVAVIVLPMFIDVKSYLPQIEQKVSEATGRPFSLGRDVDVSVFPWAGISFDNMQMGNPQKFGGGEFVKVESFEARVKLLPLLSKKIEIRKFVLNGPEVHLVKLADGSSNWSFGAQETEPPPAGAEKEQQKHEPKAPEEAPEGLQLASLEVGEFAVNGGRIVYEDREADLNRKIENITFHLKNISLDKAVDLLFSADIDGTPLTVEGSVGPIGRKPGEGTITTDLAINFADELKMTIDGTFTNPATEQKFNVHLLTEPFSPRSLLQALDMPFPVDTTDPEALSSVAADFRIEGDPSAVTLKDSSLAIDDSTLKVAAELKDMDKPDVSFKLTLDSIDVDRYLPPPRDKEAAGDVAAAPASTAPAPTAATTEQQQAAGQGTAGAEPAAIDYRPLRRLVIDGEMSVGELTAHGAAMRNVELKVVGSEGVFTLDPLRLDLYEGAIDVTGSFDVRQDSPAAAVGLKAESIEVGPLLRDSLEKEVLEGTMGAAADITFSGDTAPAVKKSLKGTGNLNFVDGAIVGIDIADMARSLAAGLGHERPEKKPRTDFAELQVPFVFENGLFQTENASLRSPLLRITAMGSADLVSERLNMRVRPKIVGTLKGQGDTEERGGLTVPILVEGTFSKPKYSADLSGLATEEALREVVENPEEAKEKIKSLEDTGKQLLKGFGIGD